MLKEELDEKVRQHRLKPPPAPKKEEKEEKKDVQKVKRQPSREKIEKRAQKDAHYVWEVLRQVFLSNLKLDSPFGITEIQVCFCKDPDNSYSFNRVFASPGSSMHCDCICRKSIKYIEETSKIVQQMAKDNGLTVGRPFYDQKWVPYNFSDFDKWLWGRPEIRGNWISFTYEAPTPE